MRAEGVTQRDDSPAASFHLPNSSGSKYLTLPTTPTLWANRFHPTVGTLACGLIRAKDKRADVVVDRRQSWLRRMTSSPSSLSPNRLANIWIIQCCYTDEQSSLFLSPSPSVSLWKLSNDSLVYRAQGGRRQSAILDTVRYCRSHHYQSISQCPKGGGE